jgi:hypothetical protein
VSALPHPVPVQENDLNQRHKKAIVCKYLEKKEIRRDTISCADKPVLINPGLAFRCHPSIAKSCFDEIEQLYKGDDYSAKLPKSINGNTTV